MKPLTLDSSGIESHLLVQCSTKPSILGTPNMFEEMPSRESIHCLVYVFGAELGGRNNLEVLSILESLDHIVGLVKLVFD